MNTEELKKLAEAATPGPWFVSAHKNVMATGGLVAFPGISSGFDQEANARLIAAANPAKILELLAIIDTLTAQRDAAVKACKAFVAYDESDYEDGVKMMLDYNDMVTSARASIAASEGGKTL